LKDLIWFPREGENPQLRRPTIEVTGFVELKKSEGEKPTNGRRKKITILGAD